MTFDKLYVIQDEEKKRFDVQIESRPDVRFATKLDGEMKWLLIDANYMCHRAFYSTGGLQYRGKMTGVVYGVLRSVISLEYEFHADGLIWCFDSRTSDRTEIFPDYKSSRKSKNKKSLTPNERRTLQEFHKQVSALRDDYLPQIGYQNVLMQAGKEADDIIASIALNLPFRHSVVIASSDHDLYQLLGSGVSMIDPMQKTYTTRKSFVEKWNIQPELWANVKAIAGCSSDDIPGIEGVGEKTAIKWMRGEIEPGSSKDEKIKNGLALVNRNMKLVKLPIEGTKKFDLVEDQITRKRWRKFLNRMGFESMQRIEPRSLKRVSRHVARKK